MIAFRRFSKSFGPQKAVSDLSFAVERGEAVALLGPNGSGKTTTLKAAAGLLRPSSGEVRIGEGELERSPWDPEARRALSYLPQKVAFPEALTGREVVDFYRGLRGVEPSRTAEALRLASLNGASGRPVGTYSGGMVQRLGLAVAVLPDAPILLLDEPTAALDPDGLCAFYGLVERRRRLGHTVLFTSHQLGDVERLADRFALLVEGRLAALLTQRELADRLAQRGLLRLRLDRRPPGLLDSVRAVSAGATWAADELVVPGAASDRPRIVDLVRNAGVTILGLTAEEGRLDALYRELIGSVA